MAGRIRDEDVGYVREHSPIDEVVGEFVALKNAGGGQKKGLCPFHDEKSPSFHVTPSKGFFHCFGCGQGGDVIAFLMKLEHLSFTETVERLAERIGYTLRYDSTGPSTGPTINRSRLVAANVAAATFYQHALAQPGPASVGREFLTKRGFDRAAAQRYGIGYAPDEWDALFKHLRGMGFSEQELMTAGLAKLGKRGPIDQFRNRLIWPIRDIAGDLVGFGARKLASDGEDQGPKYLNTAETPLYKKSQILYGIELAKKDIAKKRQVVVVEGYTDVMAAHLAGITTAVATCGTAFGDDHIRIIRRLLMDDDAFRGEVIFTFDGDAAGQKAALRAFEDDQKFVAQTFVAVEPNGLDPCELRQQRGDDAVRELIARRVPLFEFAMRTVIKGYDVSTAEGRVSALNQVVPLIGKIRDASLRPEYARLVAGWLGMEVDIVAAKVRELGGPVARSRPQAPTVAPTDPTALLEREVLKIRLQLPKLASEWGALEPNAFTYPLFDQVRKAIDASGDQDPSEFIRSVDDPEMASLLTELMVEPIRTDREVSERYIATLFARLQEVALSRSISQIKSNLQRLNPVENEAAYNEIFTELLALEARRRVQRELATGDLV